MQSKAFKWVDSQWESPLENDLDSPNTLLICFFGSALGHQPSPLFDEIRQHFPKSTLFGCSTSGEIFDSEVDDHGLVLAVLQFEKTTFRVSYTSITNASETPKSGQTIADELNEEDLAGLYILSDGLNVNGTDLVNSLSLALGRELPIVGGLAGDGVEFKQTYILDANGKPNSHLIGAIGFYGEAFSMKSGSFGGWSPFGPKRKVTKSKNNVLYELDGQPALKLYKDYLGEKSSELPGSALLFPLTIGEGKSRVVRTVLSVDETTQSMTFAGDLPQGSTAQLMMADFNRLVEGASIAADFRNGVSNTSDYSLCLAVSCVGRKLVLGARTEDETEAVREKIPSEIPLIGFYSYGEISDGGRGGKCDLHNQTMTLALLGEIKDE